MGLYVQLDTNWPDHPKVIAAGLEAAGLHAAALCLAKRLETDGVLYRGHLVRVGGTLELIDRLIDVGLLDAVDSDRVAVHDWLDRNPSREAIRGRSSWDGKRGNHKRWGHSGAIETCSICNSHNARSSAESRPPESPPSRPPESGLSLETETETETDWDPTRTTRAISFDRPDPPRLEPADIDRGLAGLAASRLATQRRPRSDCPTCNGHGWTYRDDDAEVLDPCPSCNPSVEIASEGSDSAGPA